ncbi:TetR family transcriptional regulator [Microbacterium resistens]|uniref:TetR/AcrR family transcriptional regulator n=1 Tax=Microbacterium resistens TaxID=156977 RepID=UPI001C55AF89|nr:TetR family transcriptional regulator [Microbacterium resistens]MBW1639755.1 TetR family transcriptional regulator [Microbacterium resistens]
MRSETSGAARLSSQGPSGSFIEAARRRQLVEAAIATVNEIGYHRASLAEIASRAGIVKSAVVYYFASKEGLLLDLVGTVFASLGESVLAAVDGLDEPAARLRAYAEAYVGHVDIHRRAIAAAVEIVVSHRTADGTPLYLIDDEEDTALLRSIVRAGMEHGVVRRMPLDVATGLAESVLDRAITLVQREPDIDLGELRAQVVPFLFRGLGVDDG